MGKTKKIPVFEKMSQSFGTLGGEVIEYLLFI